MVGPAARRRAIPIQHRNPPYRARSAPPASTTRLLAPAFRAYARRQTTRPLGNGCAHVGDAIKDGCIAPATRHSGCRPDPNAGREDRSGQSRGSRPVMCCCRAQWRAGSYGARCCQQRHTIRHQARPTVRAAGMVVAAGAGDGVAVLRPGVPVAGAVGQRADTSRSSPSLFAQRSSAGLGLPAAARG
jgi:hypothetical protein